MNFLKKLFGNNDEDQQLKRERNPENTKLNFLLESYAQYHSDDNYKAVVQEILEGNSYLLLPSVNERPGSGDWTTLEKDSTLTLASIFNLDGLQVLGAFSDERSLLNWTKRETEYTAMRTQDIIEFCKQNGIDRIVINSNQKKMFVLERNRENITSRTLKEDTKVLVGTPLHPLSKPIIDNLIANFKKIDTIEEAYQYAQTMNGETSVVLAVLLSTVSDNSRAALHNALNNALQKEKLQSPLDIMILEKEDWLNTVRGIHNSLFY